MATHEHVQTHVGKFEASKNLKTMTAVFITVGILGLVVGLIRDPQRLWTSYLTAFFFVTCLSLGGMFFVAVNNLAKAGWSVGLRRIAEGMTSFIPVITMGGLVLLLGLKKLYPWADPEVVASSPLIATKTAYLNTGFLIVRILIFGLGALFFAKKIVGNSLKQDQSGDEGLTHQNVGFSIGYVLFFAIFFSLFSVDLLMSLLPTWYSTIFGVYCFAGMFQSSLAFLLLILFYMRKKGFVKGYFTNEHIHDVSKYLKAFTVFWAYIAFSQFMLIWYANIPEETEYYLLRSHDAWMAISLSLLVFKFIVPFLALLPKAAKRNEGHLTLVCILILVMQYVDIYWMVYPNFFENNVTFGMYEIAMVIGFLGIFLATMTRFYTKNNLVAIKDPRMHESLSHHVSY